MKLTRLSGILAHPTSFPSPYGIGDLGKGAYEFIDFLEKGNQKIWQILPIGPTSFGDSPYQSFSTFAGNPMLISPELLVKENYLTVSDIDNVPHFDTHKIDYGKVIEYKNNLLKKAYQNFKNNSNDIQKKAYKKFCVDNFWLDDYSLFIAIKYHFIDKRKNDLGSVEFLKYEELNSKLLTEAQIKDFFYGAVWNSWPTDIKSYKKEAVKKWKLNLKDEIEYNNFLQFEFFRQWHTLKQYANKKSIKVIGDIPIFVAMDSVDVWVNKKLYFLDEEGYPTVVAGVGPDNFSETGQLWGNPLYNWAEHKKTGYKWWIDRIAVTLKCVDILRIDHFIGFVRNWAIPYGSENAVNGTWGKGPSFELFDAINKALGELPIIAEDLGVVTEEVTKLREKNNLPGMKILQFSFDSDWENIDLPHNYDNNNYVVYTGTHDNDTTVGWYKKADESSKDKMRRYLNVSGDDAVWDIIRLAFASSAGYAIIPFQDIMGLDSNFRMNTPGVASGNWQTRYTEEMLSYDIADRLFALCEMFNRGFESKKNKIN
jgi:4-alpha-glucanotransferase